MLTNVVYSRETVCSFYVRTISIGLCAGAMLVVTATTVILFLHLSWSYVITMYCRRRKMFRHTIIVTDIEDKLYTLYIYVCE